MQFIIKTERPDELEELGFELAADTRANHLRDGEEFSYISCGDLEAPYSTFAQSLINMHEENKNATP